MKYLSYFFTCFMSFLYANDISGLYLTHKGTEGGQSIVEIFKYNGKYYIYGVKNLESSPIEDICNINTELKRRKSVGIVFAYNYEEDSNGNFTNGLIYNFHNCKTYYGKIVPKDNNTISFVGALDPYYVLSLSYEWKKLNNKETQQYKEYRVPIEVLIPTINDTIKSKK